MVPSFLNTVLPNLYNNDLSLDAVQFVPRLARKHRNCIRKVNHSASVPSPFLVPLGKVARSYSETTVLWNFSDLHHICKTAREALTGEGEHMPIFDPSYLGIQSDVETTQECEIFFCTAYGLNCPPYTSHRSQRELFILHGAEC